MNRNIKIRIKLRTPETSKAMLHAYIDKAKLKDPFIQQKNVYRKLVENENWSMLDLNKKVRRQRTHRRGGLGLFTSNVQYSNSSINSIKPPPLK